MKKDKARKAAKEKAPETARETGKTVHSDVQGSWTGTPLYDEQPVQDADDL